MQTVERERREAVQQLEGYLTDVRSQLAASVSKGKADASETEARIKVLATCAAAMLCAVGCAPRTDCPCLRAGKGHGASAAAETGGHV